MLQRFEKFLTDTLGIKSFDRILVAVSGGIDSMVLLQLLNSLKIEVAIAHCNFGLRGVESDDDENFVRLHANKLGAPFFCKSFDTALHAQKFRFSIQEAARNLRYQWFEKLLLDHGFFCFATGHNFDDRLETFFINAIRGSGLSGLRSIPMKNGNCIRPLLFATREEIESYARMNNILFREDSSNFKNDYTRNKVRHYLLPALLAIDLNFRKGMEQTLENLSETEAFIQSEISNRRKSFSEIDERIIKIPMEAFKSGENSRFILFELLKPFGFNAVTVGNILSSLRLNFHTGKKFFSPEYELIIDRNDLLIRSVNRVDTAEEFLIHLETDQIEYPVKMQFHCKEINQGFEIDKSGTVAQMDFEKLNFPLKIRKYKTGDYFYPIGMSGRKLVSDFFTDIKLSLFDKRDVWMLESGSEIVWIIGHRMDERYKITSNTRRAFTCRII